MNDKRKPCFVGILFLLVSCSGIDRIRGLEKDCGIECLAVAMTALNVDYALDHLEKQFGPASVEGFQLSKLADVAQVYGLKTCAVETSLEELAIRKDYQSFACIAWLPRKHFVLISDFDGERVTIIDPPLYTELDAASFVTNWKGQALLLSKTELPPVSTLRLWNRFKRVVGTLAILIPVGLVVLYILYHRKVQLVIAAICACNCSMQLSAQTIRDVTISSDAQAAHAISKPIDLGDLAFGSRDIFKFNLVNGSDRPITIQDIGMNCSCISVLPTKKELLAKSSVAVQFQVATTSRGKHVAQFRIRTDTAGVIDVPLSFSIEPVFKSAPEEIDFGKLEPHSKTHMEVVIMRVRDGQNVMPRKLRVESSHPEVLQVETDGNVVQLRLIEPVRLRQPNASLMLIDEDSVNVHSMPVRWQIKSHPYQTLPKFIRVFFGEGPTQSKVITIASRSGELPRIKSVDSPLKIAEWSQQEIEPDTCSLTVVFERPTEQLRIGQLEISFENEDIPVLVLPMGFRIDRGP